MKFSAQKAFTLIELLVVIAIMGMIGTYVLANYRSFGEDQNLKSAVLNVVSLLKIAQTNATTNANCNTQYSATWQVIFSDTKTISLNCLESATSFTKKTLKLDEKVPNISIFSVSGAPAVTSCPVLPFTVGLALLKGTVSFIDNSTSDLGIPKPNCTSLTVTLQNTKLPVGREKSLIIEQGGRIYAQ